MRILRYAALLVLLGTALAARTEDRKEIPAFNELPAELLFPRNPEIRIASDGKLLINGVPRYLIGVTYEKDYRIPLTTHTPGYSKEWNWLYEHALDYQGFQRLGIDAVSSFLPDDWIEENGFRSREKYLAFVPDEMKRYFTSGIPLSLNLSPSGRIPVSGPGKPDVSAFINNPKNAAIRPLYYSFTTPAGRELWRALWSGSLSFVSSLGGSPAFCELLSRPTYDDRSDWNRRMFVAELRKKYHNDLDELNRMWQTAYPNFDAIGRFERLVPEALRIEWRKFMETCVENLCVEAKREICAATPNHSPLFIVRFSQLDENEDNVNRYRLSRMLDVISGQARSIYELRLLHAQAAGKLLFNPELNMDRKYWPADRRNGIRNLIWLDFIRGYDISYLFRWSKEVRSWKNSDLDSRLLDPRSFSKEDLAGILDAKQEIQKYGGAFVRRDRGMPNSIAVLYSCAAERLRSERNECAFAVTQAISDECFGYDVIFEESLSGALDTGRYRVIVAPDIHQSLDSTPEQLRRFVENGGTLLLFQGALEKNEYDFPRPGSTFPGIAIGTEVHDMSHDIRVSGHQFNTSPVYEISSLHSWKSIGKYNLTPLCIFRHIGKGQVYFLNMRLNEPDMCKLVTILLNRCGIFPFCRILNERTAQPVSGIEVWPARGTDGAISYFLFNQTQDARLVRFIPLKGNSFYDPLNSRRYNGSSGFPVYLPPKIGILLLAGEKPEVAPPLPLPAEPPSKYGDIFFCNLNSAVNCASTDSIPFSGPGGDYGWLDIGSRGSFLEIPKKYIFCERTMFRLTNNQRRDNISLKSEEYPERPESVTIPVNERASELVFLHAVAAYLPYGHEVFRYTICFADGTKETIPIRFGIEVDDWRETRFAFSAATGKQIRKCFPAWRNSYDRGLFGFRWYNRKKPDIPISSVIFSVVEQKAVSLLCAITGKRYAHEFSMDLRYGMAEAAPELPAGGELKLDFPEPVTIPEDFNSVELQITAVGVGEDDFEVKVDNSAWLTAKILWRQNERNARCYSIPEFLFSPHGKGKQIKTIFFRRKASVPTSRRIVFPKLLLYGNRSAQPLALHLSTFSGKGLNVEQCGINRLRLHFNPGEEYGTLTLKYPGTPILENFFPKRCFVFSCLADKEAESGEISFVWQNQKTTVRSPWVKFHLQTQNWSNETISGMLVVPHRIKSPKLLQILFRFRKSPGGAAEPVINLMDFQLL